MCGIVGLISKSSTGFKFDDSDLFTQLLQMDTIRGKDSTGAFGVDSAGKVDLIKGDTNGWEFTQCTNYKDFCKRMYHQYRIVIGHNRAATKGAITPQNAHPFKEDNICLVHNGTIHNKDALDANVEVDSHAIAMALSKQDAAKALNSIHGAFALVWFDQTLQTLNLARNSERPLFLLEYENHWTISSEAGLAYWLNGRMTGNKIVGTPKLVPTEKIIQFDLKNLADQPKELEYSNYKWVNPNPPIVPTHNISQTYRSYQNRSTPSASSSLKQGDEVVFTVEEVKYEPGDPVHTVFGHPIFNNNKDENILIKTEKAFQSDADALVAAGHGMGTITAIGKAGSMTILYLKFTNPHTIHQDAGGTTSTEEDIKKAIADGCNRCKGAMSFVDIAESIVRKKKDGTYRTLCKKCLTESKANMVNNQGNPRAN